MPTETARVGEPGPERPRVSVAVWCDTLNQKWYATARVGDLSDADRLRAKEYRAHLFTIPGSAETRAGVEEVMKLAKHFAELHADVVYMNSEENGATPNQLEKRDDAATALESAIRRLAGEQA